MSRNIKPKPDGPVYPHMTPFELDSDPTKYDGFRVPDGYFDTLTDRVFDRLEATPVTVPRKRYGRRRNWYAAVAAVALLALVVPFAWQQFAAAPIDDITLENYLNDEADLSSYEVGELLDEHDISRLEAQLPVDDQAIEDALYQNANLENYIAD
ncbi:MULTISPECIES: hypothetical protein [unclassified Flavobacterium]|uniref:hypothetical protein n=1 Tax=unclassified Flavobacterium TaxID=196869 RepID=UPI001F13D678|nr:MULTISPECIES: hypothetical protein [unclassified Flavobacterium]UMY64797.1 hypothetical protein MKO97_09755 [Flavobacterium sp. HJ-32-4]